MIINDLAADEDCSQYGSRGAWSSLLLRWLVWIDERPAGTGVTARRAAAREVARRMSAAVSARRARSG